ncbi:MAG: hypothetical protein PVF09_02640 [Desulfobacterales bacterium]|jgi:hypothetical protein
MKQTAYISNRNDGFYGFSVVMVAFIWSIIMVHPLYGAEESKAAKIDAHVNEALQRFYEQVEDAKEVAKRAKGWEAGVDGNVALFNVGGGQKSLSAMNENPILAFVFDVKGLIADMSIKGAKFNILDLSK